VTESISRLGLNISFAKIATRVDGIVDAFYVLDQSGQPVLDPVRRTAIRDSILQTITSTTELAPA
jgi:[protein-PII] uridylyltransferase